MYLLFGGQEFYAAGGINDFFGKFDNITSALLEVENLKKKFVWLEWWQIVDAGTFEIVLKDGAPYGCSYYFDEEDI